MSPVPKVLAAPRSATAIPKLVRVGGALFCFFILHFSFCLRASAASIDWFKTSAGGGASVSGNSSITGTIGQSDAGEMSNGNSSLIGGFWSVADPAQTWLTLVSSLNPARPGSNVVFTATLTGDADLATPTGTVQFTTNGAAFGSAITFNGGAIQFTNAILPHGSNAIAAEYSGDDNFLAGGGGVSQIINRSPTNGVVALRVSENTAANVASNILAQAVRDPDLDSLAIASFDTSSAQNGIIGYSGGVFTYSPANNYVGADSFTYVVTDPFNASATNTINVTVESGSTPAPTLNISGVSPTSGIVQVFGSGRPLDDYIVQRSTNLVDWADIGATNALANGLILFIDTNPPPISADYRFKLQ